MFPNKSSSYEISSKANAFVQNFKEEAVLDATAVAGRTLSSTIPTDQVPDSRDTAFDGGPVVNENNSPAEAAVLMSPLLVPGGVTTSTPPHTTRIKSPHTGCEPCGCSDYPSKSEAECGRHTVGTGLGGREGCRAGPLSTLLNPNSISLSLSVISSSTCSARQPPPSLHCSALQEPNAMFASEYCGSSNSNSLSAQKKHHNTIIPHITSQANHSQPESDKIGALLIQDNNNNISIKDINNNCNNNIKRNNNYNEDDDTFSNNNSKFNNKVDNKTSVRKCEESENIPGKIITPCCSTTIVRMEQSFKNDCDDYGTRWGIPRGLRLAGGGESSLNTSGTGWGSSGGNNNTNNAGSGSSWGPGGSQNNNSGAQPPAGNPPASQWPGNSRGQANTTSQGQPPSSQQNTGNSGMKSAAVSVAVSGNQPQNSNNSNQPQNQQQNQQQQQQQQQNQQSQNQPNQQGQQPSGGNSNNQQGQQNGSTSWAAAAGKGLPPSGSSGAPSSTTTTTTSTNNSSNSTTAKQQLEQLNTMREALFSLDGWGGQHVNQDSSWDIPPSPEPSGKDNNGGAALPVWKPNINNGTELWEANLRNGGQPPPAVAQKTPWGHTPTTNIGGTWGEDDDVGDTSNVWTGVPPAGAAPPPTQWGGANNPGPATPMWAPKKETEWGGGSNWGDPRGAGAGGMDPRDIRTGAGGMVDPRDHMRTVIDQSRVMGGGDAMMRDPRGGITGRLNSGTSDPMWGGPPQQPPHHVPHHQAQPPNKMGPAPNAPVNQWPGPPPKDIGGGMPGVGVNIGGKPTGWEEPSPPAQRRNIPNYDDGTSLWGGAQQQRNAMTGQAKVSHWKEMPTPSGIGRGMSQCPPGIPQNTRMPNASMPGNMKSDGPIWGHPARNGAWEAGSHDVGSGAPWGEDKVSSGVMTPWSEPPITPTPWGGPKPKPMNSGWVDGGDVDPSTWGHPPKQAPKPLSKELIWASKQFRILSEMGFKKEEVEHALRIYNMSLEDALDYLNAMRGLSGGVGDWRGRHADMDPPFDHPVNNPPSFPGRFNPQQMPFPPGGGPTSASNLLNNPGNPNLSNISPAIVQKILQQPPPQQAPSQQPTPFNQTSRTPQNQPSAQQLRMLVQQIQMAVSAGYLNHQILNQPLAPQTLLLLNQLLQQIKCLQQLMTQQNLAVQQAPMGKGANSTTVLSISVQITKIKQQITNLQNQIAAQQAVYVKQQQQQQQQQQAQQQQQHHMPPQSQSDFFKTNMHDPLAAIQSNFSELAINKDTQVVINHNQQQQSRLNQWKLPSLDNKDGDLGGNEFSRAPGTTTKSQGNSSPNPLNPLLSQADGTWSSVTRSSGDTGWPDSSSVDVSSSDKDWPVVTTTASQAFTDLVPEFEPGKPWKGNQMKSIEDDPSITPGSVVRSPLSLPSIKDSEIFSSGATNSSGGTANSVGGGNGNGGGKSSPTTSGSMDMPIPSLSLSSNTWSFQPPASSTPSFNSNSFFSPLSKLGGGVGSTSKNTWGEGPPPSELWSNPKPRQGPPPGLSKAPPTPGTSTASNGWGSLSGRWGSQPNPSWGSPWLLLKNLTPQIDGSTLKTLCLQHGPLQNFHMYLSHNIALAKYNTREEAAKAQGALNNCVLGNTTIFADTPPESDVHTLLHSFGQQSSAGGASWSLRSGTGGPSSAQQSVKNAPPPTSADTWGSGSQLWPGNSGGSTLWGTSPLDASDPHRATPSLNSFLPGDLLGGESM